MTKTIWHSGPPPSCGWWPASAFQDAEILRWWNGRFWSLSCTRNDSATQASRDALMPSNMNYIKWTERPKTWPERSKT